MPTKPKTRYADKSRRLCTSCRRARTIPETCPDCRYLVWLTLTEPDRRAVRVAAATEGLTANKFIEKKLVEILRDSA